MIININGNEYAILTEAIIEGEMSRMSGIMTFSRTARNNDTDYKIYYNYSDGWWYNIVVCREVASRSNTIYPQCE